jgi:cytochrome c oxidase subunit 2
MRNKNHMIKKVMNINKLRNEKNKELISKGLTTLDDYTFNYLLLCNKICGASHYNMQMKIIVDEPKDFEFLVDIETRMAKVMRLQNREAEAVEIERRLKSVTEAMEEEKED